MSGFAQTIVFCPELSAFTRKVPVCLDAAGIAAAREVLRDRDRAVVIDDRRQAIGTVTAEGLQTLLPARTTPDKRLSDLGDGVLEPVLVLSASLTFEGLQGDFPNWNSVTSEVVFVDANGEIVGLLDRDRLARFFAEQPKLKPSAIAIEMPCPPLSFLVRLLDRLPVPCELQGDAGVALAQNSAWRRWWDSLREGEGDRTAARLFEIGTPTDNGYLYSCRTHSGERQLWHLTRVALDDLCLAGDRLSESQETLDAWFPWTPLVQALPFQIAAGYRVRPCDLAFSPPTTPDRLWLVLARDVTDRQKRTKELSAKNADLLQLDRLKTELLTCVSHELKTPLTGLLGLSNLLQNPNCGPLNPRQAEYARLIYRSSRQMMTVVNYLYDLTQIETGELTLKPQRVSVRDCAAKAEREIRQVNAETDLPEFSLEVTPRAETALADPMRLCQILSYLLWNAIARTPRDGQVGVRVERWDDWIAFVVWDTGIGIRADAQPFVFQSYQEIAPMSDLERTIPVGLSLILAQRLARLHGGEINFTSQEGGGSQFTLLLPARDLEAETPVSGPVGDRSTGRFVLVVDGDIARATPLVDALNSWDYRVVLARSGPEALAKARQLHPERIFLTPTLPILSGTDVLTLLKANADTRDLPVVWVTPTWERPKLPETVEAWLGLPLKRQQLAEILEEANSETPAATALTVLWLLDTGTIDNSAKTRSELDRLFHHYHYRVVEVDDLEQAEVLAKVWKPDVVLLDRTGNSENPTPYLEAFVQHPDLVSLPLVTLDPITTATANRVFADRDLPLQVFPCLTAPDAVSPVSGVPAVLEVVRIAARSTTSG
ncbi:ATP-binding protein [Baaleninema sp.]|uniref:ATP-binding protein n=1 Tax=Baaleninema sp. TaxID=3101197 RepID=UPI003D05B7CC